MIILCIIIWRKCTIEEKLTHYMKAAIENISKLKKFPTFSFNFSQNVDNMVSCWMSANISHTNLQKSCGRNKTHFHYLFFAFFFCF